MASENRYYEVIGLTEADALKTFERNNKQVVIRQRDGQLFPVNYDWDPRRVTLRVMGNCVIEAEIG